jgi:hypothetical protein
MGTPEKPFGAEESEMKSQSESVDLAVDVVLHIMIGPTNGEIEIYINDVTCFLHSTQFEIPTMRISRNLLNCCALPSSEIEGLRAIRGTTFPVRNRSSVGEKSLLAKVQ